MKTFRCIARQLPTRFQGRGKAVSYSAMLLLSLGSPAPSAPVSSSTPPSEQILSRMEERYERQVRTLESYQARRRYSVTETVMSKPAYLLVEEQYRAPEEKQFRVLERGGPAQVQERVFSRLLEVEQETARTAVRRQVDLSRRNYQFTFQQYDPAARAYVFAVEPRNSNPYLLRGKVWINQQDFAVQRIEGEPVGRQSAFIRQTHFVHEFARFGDFWFPVHHRSETDLLLLGRAVLEISYFNYHWEMQKEERP